ncbi:MAG TPA: septum formation initiator family protein [Thermoanaerobaculia bacterium]|jgi:cell division protein FtsL|nr:septum formation initiator family protein [Thermoanaerobaculia bacterium]
MHPAVSTRAPRPAAQAIRRIAVILVALLILGGIASLFVTGRATSELQQSRKRVESLHAEIQQLQQENARLRAEIESVRNSTYAVERIAREDLGMSKRGEVIYLLPR